MRIDPDAQPASDGVVAMGDENPVPASGGFMFKTDSDGEWQNLGYVDEGGISLTADSDEEELDRWHAVSFRKALLKLNELKLPWYMENEWYRIFTGRLKHTVPTLRRGRKGHKRC